MFLPSNDLTLLFKDSQSGIPLIISKHIEPKLHTSNIYEISVKSAIQKLF
jgi:hypothetical protein